MAQVTPETLDGGALVLEPPERDPAGMLELLFVALGPAVRFVAGLVEREGPTPTMVALAALLVGLALVELRELAHAARTPAGRSERWTSPTWP